MAAALNESEPGFRIFAMRLRGRRILMRLCQSFSFFLNPPFKFLFGPAHVLAPVGS